MRETERKWADSYADLADAPGIAAASVIRSGQVPIGKRGALTSMVGFKVLHGDAIPQIVTGRMPNALGEIAIGPRIARSEHLGLGDQIPVGDGPTATTLRVVGTVALPGLGFYSGNDAPPVGGSAVVTLDQFVELVAPGAGTYGVVRYDSEITKCKRHGVVTAALHTTESFNGASLDDVVRRNVDVVALANVRRTPLLLVATLSVLTLVTLTQALFTESRKRRRMLAVLSVLGATPRSARRLVTTHALLVVGISMVLGCIIGVGLGRAAWKAAAFSVGVLPGHVVPFARLALAGVAALVLGWLASWWPSRAALRGASTGVLRAE